MKLLVVFTGLLAVTASSPINPGYGLPAAVPIEAVSLPVAPQVIEPALIRATPLLRQAPILPLSPSPIARVASPVLSLPRVAAVAAPAPLPAAFAARAALPLALPAPVPAPAPLAATPVPVAPAPLPLAAAVPVPATAPSSQFHAQDEAGGFSFGYANGNSIKNEVRTPDGVTRGFYEYVDANNQVQRVEYIADALGFRVAGTNLPVAAAPGPVAVAPVVVADTPEVVEAKLRFQEAFDAAVAREAVVAAALDPVVEPLPAVVEEVAPVKVALPLRKKRSADPIEAGYGLPAAPAVATVRAVSPLLPAAPVTVVPAPAPLPLAAAPASLPLAAAPVPLPLAAAPAPLPLAAAPVPLPLAAAPVVAPAQAVIPAPAALPLAAAPVTPVSQYHAQDELGGTSFGYVNGNSARQEVRTPDGVTQGSYSYVDGFGITQTVNYIADALGFRVTGTNLPVAPLA